MVPRVHGCCFRWEDGAAAGGIITIVTSEPMAKLILQMVTERQTVTFAEIADAIGQDAHGDITWSIAPNIVLWVGLSEALMNAFETLRHQIEPYPTNLLVYLHDGAALKLPVAKRVTKKGYKEPHWLPVVFNTRKSTSHKG